MSEPTRALLLDAVDTVISLVEPPAEIYARAARAHGIEVDAGTVRARLFASRIGPPPLDGLELSLVPALEREGWRDVVRRALGDAAADGSCFDELHAHFTRPQAWRVAAGAPEALGRARARGVRVGVVSNMDSRLPPLLDAHGLAPLLDCVVIPSTSGLRKPDPRIFAAALRLLDAAPAAGLYIGDREEDCVEAARRAGLRALRYDPAAAADAPGTLPSWDGLDAHLG